MSFAPRSRPFSYNSFRSVGNKRSSTNNDPNYYSFSKYDTISVGYIPLQMQTNFKLWFLIPFAQPSIPNKNDETLFMFYFYKLNTVH